MTTPGGQLTPGDESTPPVYGVPDGAYVGDAGSPNAITDLNNLTEDEAKKRMQAPIGPSFTAQRDGIWGFFNDILSILNGAVGLVVGAVEAVVNGIKGIFNAIGSLFGLSRQDTAAVDLARANGERAIAEAMSGSLEHLDEVQRFGAAFMGCNTFALDNGEIFPHHIPLTDLYPLAAGTRMIPPVNPLLHSSGYRFDGGSAGQRATSAARIAQGTGQLELLESGLWLLHFQAAVLQGNAYTTRPVDVWCHVTPAESEWLPVGPPDLTATNTPSPGNQLVRSRVTGGGGQIPTADFVAAYGRAAAYVHDRNTDLGGGNTVSGLVVAYLETGNWKVSLSCNSWEKYSGAMSTYVYATKVNSETLRQDIDEFQEHLGDVLPGTPVDLLMDEAAIQAMIAQAEDLEVDPVTLPEEVPTNE